MSNTPLATRMLGTYESPVPHSCNHQRECVNNTHSIPSIPPIETPLSAQALALILPLHPVTILRWAREDKLPHRHLGSRRIVFLPSEVADWLASGCPDYTEHATRAAQPEGRAA